MLRDPTEYQPVPFLVKVDDPETEKRIRTAIANFRGPGPTLGSALGALVMGQHYGYRGLRMMHSPSTYRKYERVLGGIKFEDVCPELPPLGNRIVGIRVAKKLGAFWDVVMGRRKVENKGYVDDNGADATHG